MLVPLLALAAPAYRIVDLGLPPGAKATEAVAINDRGEVLVSATVPALPASLGESRRPFLWRGGRFLGFGESPYAGMERTSVQADALNDYGAVVGACGGFGPLFMSGLEDKKAFVWNGRKMALLFPGNTIAEEANDINDRGDIVGDDSQGSFARLRGKTVSLPTASRVEPRDPSGELQDVNQSSGVAINDRRLILMNSTFGKKEGGYGLPSRPYLVNGEARPLRARPLPLPKGFAQGRGVALNERGTVLAVAYSDDRKTEAPCQARRGKTVRLPFGGALGPQDEVVGGSPLAVWREGRTQRLPDFPGWTLRTATGINDRGAICGTGLHDGETRAYVLLPR